MTRPAVHRTDVDLRPDGVRVVGRPHVPGDDERLAGIVGRVLRLTPDEVRVELEDVHHRFAGRHRDLPLLLENRCRLLTFEDRAFAVLGDFGVVPLLGGRDEEAATAVLAGAMAACPPGTTISLGFLTAGQQWAVRACLEAGLVLSPDGPVFLSGDVGPFAPYVPSGWFL